MTRVAILDRDGTIIDVVRDEETGLEYQGSSWNGLFAQRRNLFNPRFLRMLGQIGRFNTAAVQALDDPRYAEYSLGQFLKTDRGGAGGDFAEEIFH